MDPYYEQLLAAAPSTALSPQAAAEAAAFNADRLGLPRPEGPEGPREAGDDAFADMPPLVEDEDPQSEEEEEEKEDEEDEEDAVEDTWWLSMQGLALRMNEIWPLPSDPPKPAEDADAAATGGDAVAVVEGEVEMTEEAAEAVLIANVSAAPPGGSPAPAFSRRQEVLARSEAVDTAVLKGAKLARKALDAGEVKPDPAGERLEKEVATHGMDRVHRQKHQHLSDNLKINRKTLSRQLKLFTAVTVSVYYTGMRFMCSEFVRDVKAKQGVCQQYTEFWRWDETPQKLTIVDQDQVDLLDTELFPRASNALKALRAKLKEDLRDVAPSKLLQSEVLIYLLAAFAGGRFVVLIVKPMLPCLIMERNTTETLWICLRTLELRIAMGKIKRFFKKVQRIVTTDDFSANSKHERAIAKDRP